MTPPPLCRRGRPRRPATVAVGLLAITLVAACGSSGEAGSVAGPSAAGSSPSVSVSPSATGSSSPSPKAGAQSLRDFHDASTGLSLTLPVGYVVATTPAQAAARFPAVLGVGSGVAQQITDSVAELKSNTIMIAFRPPIGGVSDTVRVIKLAGEAPSDRTQIQSSVFVGQVRASLVKVGAKNVTFTETTIGGQPAEQIEYAITPAGGTVYGRQFFLAEKQDIFVVTITAGTVARAAAAGDFIAASWTVA
jgi:hypothetical protein